MLDDDFFSNFTLANGRLNEGTCLTSLLISYGFDKLFGLFFMGIRCLPNCSFPFFLLFQRIYSPKQLFGHLLHFASDVSRRLPVSHMLEVCPPGSPLPSSIPFSSSNWLILLCCKTFYVYYFTTFHSKSVSTLN